MKKILIIMAFLFVLPMAGQKSRITLVFKDGKTLTGLGKIVKNKVKFKRNDKKTSTVYTKEDLKFFYIREGRADIKYYYKKVKGKKNTLLLKLLEEGKANLFVEITNSYIMSGPENMTMASRSKSTYYIAKNIHDKEVFKVLSKAFGKPFNKAASKYFSDCVIVAASIGEKVKNFRKHDIVNIVKVYNSDCK